jgi:uncharacterized OB-fold protein
MSPPEPVRRHAASGETLDDAPDNAVGPDARYASALAAGRIELQTCSTCARQVFPPRVACPHCGSPALAWRPISGAGAVYSTTVVRQRPDEGGDYNVALVDLAEGARMMSRIEGIPPQSVRIGMPVRARIATTKAGPLVVFDPSEGA